MAKEVYGIALFSWDGWTFSFDNARLFSTQESRDAEYERLSETEFYANGDGMLRKFENEIEE